jgi:hypothetical protein
MSFGMIAPSNMVKAEKTRKGTKGENGMGEP